MRRWISPFVLLLAVAGVIALVLLRDSRHAEPIESEHARAAQGQPDPAGVEDALQADPAHARSALAIGPDQPADTSAVPRQSDPPAAHMTVRVISATSHAPVANIRIVLSPLPRTEGELETEAVTGAEGVVHLDLPPARDFRARARTEDSGGSGPGLTSPAEVADGYSYTVHFEHDLRIRATGGQATAGGTSVDLPQLRAGEERELVLVIEEELQGRVVGKVVCAETREPVAGARVRVLTGGHVRTEWHTPGPDERTTGNDGQFELPFLLASDPLLCVEAPGYGLRYTSLDAVHADLAHALIVYVSRAASLSARVLDAAGAPIPDAWIELSVRGNLLARHEADEQGFYSSGISFSFPPDEHWRAQTGADGRAKIDGIAPQVEIDAAVVKDGKQLRHEAAGLKFEPGENREVEWRIGSGTTVRGLALDQDGKPVANLEVWASIAGAGGNRYLMSYETNRLGARGNTDADGRFTLQDLAPGRWAIGPGAENASSVASVAEFVELTGEPLLELTLHVSRGLYIRGRVLAPNGEGAPNVWVNGFVPPRDGPEGVSTERDGNFAFGPVGPGTFTLTTTAVGRFASSDPVQANGGDSGIVLRLKQGGTIRGRVVDGVTGAACAAQLVFGIEDSLSDSSDYCMQTTTQPDGSFASAGFRVGRWSVTASTADGRFAQHAHIDVAPGSDSGELVLALSPGGMLHLGYKGAQPQVYVTITSLGAAVNFATSIGPGKSTDCLAPAGALVLEIRKSWSGPARTKAVDLKPGETQEIVLTDEN